MNNGTARWTAAVALLVVALSALALVLGSRQRTVGSLGLDEPAHYDYVLDLRHGSIPAWGDQLGQVTLRTVSCLEDRGCAVRDRSASAYGAGGFNYEAQQPPLAYVPFVLLARPSLSPRAALGSARRGGEVWTVVSAALLAVMAWALDLDLLETAVVMAVCLLSPVAVFAGATVTNDSSALAAGAVAVLVATKARERPLLGAAAGILLSALKGSFVIAPAVLVVAGLLAGQRRRRQTGVIAMSATAAGGYVAWTLVQTARQKLPSGTVLHALLGFQTSPYPEPSTMINGLEDQLRMLLPYGTGIAGLYFVWDVVVFGVLGGAAFGRDGPGRPWALAGCIGLLGAAIAVPVLDFVQGHFNFGAPARYGLPLLPMVAVVFARSLTRRGLAIFGVLLPAGAATVQLLAH